VITEDPIFGLKVQNLAIETIRREFADYLELLAEDGFVQGLRMVKNPVVLPLFTWRWLPRGAMTLILQRSILGVESCVSAAVSYQLGAMGLLTPEKAAELNYPVKLPGKGNGMANAFYNKLPAQIDLGFSLETMDANLWAVVSRLYREVRNPLFHGCELSETNPTGVLEALKVLKRLYGWMDSWWGCFQKQQPAKL
jgi:hypothetical protein